MDAFISLTRMLAVGAKAHPREVVLAHVAKLEEAKVEGRLYIHKVQASNTKADTNPNHAKMMNASWLSRANDMAFN
jgi:hypothetical protein